MSKEYLKTKLGADAIKPVLNLMEQIWPDAKNFEGKDVVITALDHVPAIENKLKSQNPKSIIRLIES